MEVLDCQNRFNTSRLLELEQALIANIGSFSQHERRQVRKTRRNNRESFTVIKYVDGDGADIPPWVIFNSIEIQGTSAENDVSGSVVFTTAELKLYK